MFVPAESSSPIPAFFDPTSPVSQLSGNLPHWRQAGVTYFVTFRLADALPQEKLAQWRRELSAWHATHPEPHSEDTRREYHDLFPARLQRWLDAGYGSCVLELEPVREQVEGALRHFHATRYLLGECVVARNHVHALVTPLGEHPLSDILHSWKSFTAHKILKVEATSRRLAAARGEESGSRGSGVPPLNPSQRDQSRDGSATLTVWQKESFDHIVRSPASLEKIREYIRAHRPDSNSR